MIRSIYVLTCDLCGGKIELDEHASEKNLTDWARKHGWDVDGNPLDSSRFDPQSHYCPDCKVPAKIAKAMEAAP